jgi:hypothetical protein
METFFVTKVSVKKFEFSLSPVIYFDEWRRLQLISFDI